MTCKLFGDDDYFVIVNATVHVNGIKNHIVTTFNKKQAKVGYDVLTNTHENRTQFATKILNALELMKANNELRLDTNFHATLKNKDNGIIHNIPVSLHWRAMRLLALTCMSSEFQIAQLSGVLRNIECGMYERKQTVNPFELEGTK